MDTSKIVDSAKALVDRQREHTVSLVAAGLAFYGMLTLVPALVALVSIYGLASDPDEVTTQVADLTESLPASTADFVQEQLVLVAGSAAAGLGISAVVSIALALWSTSGAMAALVKAIGIAWGDTEKRSILEIRGKALGMTVLAVVAVAITIGISVVVPAWLSSLGGGGALLGNVLRWVSLFALAAVTLTLIYRFSPTSHERRHHLVSAGGIFATVAIVVGTALFTFFVSNFGTFNETYGTLAGIIVLLLWLYLCGFAAVLGAELDAHLAPGRNGRR